MDFLGILHSFFEAYGMEILYGILTFIAGYLGLMLKNIYQKVVNDKTKEKVAQTVVKATEQIYKDLHGEEKLNKALESASEMLAEKGIAITDLELRMLLESALAEFNNAFNKANSTETTDANVA